MVARGRKRTLLTAHTQAVSSTWWSCPLTGPPRFLRRSKRTGANTYCKVLYFLTLSVFSRTPPVLSDRLQCLTGGDGQVKVWDTQGWQCECTLGGIDYGVASAAWVGVGDGAGYGNNIIYFMFSAEFHPKVTELSLSSSKPSFMSLLFEIFRSIVLGGGINGQLVMWDRRLSGLASETPVWC